MEASILRKENVEAFGWSLEFFVSSVIPLICFIHLYLSTMLSLHSKLVCCILLLRFIKLNHVFSGTIGNLVVLKHIVSSGIFPSLLTYYHSVEGVLGYMC